MDMYFTQRLPVSCVLTRSQMYSVGLSSGAHVGRNSIWMAVSYGAAAPEQQVSGNRPGSAEATLSSRWARTFLITTGSSMPAMTLTAPPHSRQVLMSMLNTRNVSTCFVQLLQS